MSLTSKKDTDLVFLNYVEMAIKFDNENGEKILKLSAQVDGSNPFSLVDIQWRIGNRNEDDYFELRLINIENKESSRPGNEEDVNNIKKLLNFFKHVNRIKMDRQPYIQKPGVPYKTGGNILLYFESPSATLLVFQVLYF